METTVDIDSVDSQARELIKKVGAFARREFDQFSYSDAQYKGRGDLFSYVDLQTEQLLKAGCESLVPGSGFILEEGDNITSDNSYSWIIDPIDGTTNFVHGIPFYTISVALQYNQETVLGYVYDVQNDDLFHARKSRGAYLNANKIQVSTKPTLGDGVISTNFPVPDLLHKERYFHMLSELLENTHGLRRFGSAALELAWVACGRLDGFFEFGLNPWDIAGGALIIEEAGGRVTDLYGNQGYLNNRQLVSSNGLLHEALLELVQRHEPLKSLNK